MRFCDRLASGVLSAAIFATSALAQQQCHPEPLDSARAKLREGSACAGLTLTDAVNLAQKQGLSAEASREALAAARAHDRAFSARLMPQISLDATGANYNHSIINAIDASTGATQFVAQSRSESQAGVVISQVLPWFGSTVSVGSYIDRVDQSGNLSQRTYVSRPFQFSIAQDLFKPRARLWDLRAQDIRASLAERQYLESREDAALNTSSAFFDYYAANVALRNALANAAVNDTLYTLNKGRFEVGKIGENELLQSELQLLRARASVDGAKLERDRTESALRRVINVHGTDTLVVVPPQDVPTIDADPEIAVQQALRHASVMEQSALDSVNARRFETQARLLNGFGATIRASYGTNQTSNLFGLAYASPLPQQTFSMSVNMPVFQWGGGRADVEEARANKAQVASNTRARREQLMEDARYAALQLTQSQRMLLIAAKADTVAQKRFEVAKNRYIIGKIGVSDLYIAQNEKDQALESYVQALRSYWTNYYHLRRVTLYDFVQKSELQ